MRKGFDFLVYHFGPEGLSVARKTIENFVARAIRLYEQEPGEALASSRFGLYVERWVRWTEAGIPERPNVPVHQDRCLVTGWRLPEGGPVNYGVGRTFSKAP